MAIVNKLREKLNKQKELIVDSNLPDVRKIEVPDLKQYLIKGCEEIRKVKFEKEELEIKLEEQSKFEQLYESALVTTEEFRKRDEENHKKIENLNKRIESKNEEIKQLNDTINTYKIREKETIKKEEQLNKTIREAEKERVEQLKNKLINTILNIKGNISKNKICDIIQKGDE